MDSTSRRADCDLMPGNVTSPSVGVRPNFNSSQALLIMFIIGCVSVMVAKMFQILTSQVYQQLDSGDNSFDAGGNVSVGLTATTLVSQWTWAATLLQSSSVASKYGIAGSFWYAAGATIQILLFAMISVQLKIRAPGAKTFLQVIWARFDKKTHVTFTVFALTTNIIVTSMLMLGGTAVLTNLIKDFSVEYATCLICAVIGSYTFIGGLGATFYMSYCTTTVIFVILLICVIQVFHTDSPKNPLGSVSKVYNYVNCAYGPASNEGASFLTMISLDGLMFGIINIVGNFGTVFVDQSYWQSSVAAKPRTGALGFLSGGLVWFAIPFCFATSMGLGFISLSYMQGEPILMPDDVNKGLVPPAVVQRLLGLPGELMIVVMLIMAVISTASAEIVAVVSILIYDVYAVHLKPYRAALDANSCILCGKAKGRMANPRDKCACESMTFCAECRQDNEAIATNKRALKPAYKCKIHGAYRTYKDCLSSMRDWCVVYTTLAIIPVTFILNFMKISLNWLYLFMGVLIGSAVAPICLSMFWARLTGNAMIAGSVSGTVLGLATWLVTAAFMPGGLTNFMSSTGSNEAMLAGNLVSIGLGLVVTVAVTMVTNRNLEPEKAAEVWEVTRDIDNPLQPWAELYSKEMNLSGAHCLDSRPSLEATKKAFRMAKYIANFGSIGLTVMLILIWPASMLSVKKLDLSGFTSWITLVDVWGFAAAVFIIILPVINEVLAIRDALRQRKRVAGD